MLRHCLKSLTCRYFGGSAAWLLIARLVNSKAINLACEGFIMALVCLGVLIFLAETELKGAYH